jgi:hypothetical protein
MFVIRSRAGECRGVAATVVATNGRSGSSLPPAGISSLAEALCS